MKIVVDTNIIFSTLLNTNGTIGNILFNSKKHFDFYSCSYMRFEIQKHWDKLKSISKLTDEQLEISRQEVFSKLNFINENLIPVEFWMEAERLTKDIDEDDVDFVALTLFLKARLWTGDKVLYKGLKKAEIISVLTSEEMNALRKQKFY